MCKMSSYTLGTQMFMHVSEKIKNIVTDEGWIDKYVDEGTIQTTGIKYIGIGVLKPGRLGRGREVDEGSF